MFGGVSEKACPGIPTGSIYIFCRIPTNEKGKWGGEKFNNPSVLGKAVFGYFVIEKKRY